MMVNHVTIGNILRFCMYYIFILCIYYWKNYEMWWFFYSFV